MSKIDLRLPAIFLLALLLAVGAVVATGAEKASNENVTSESSAEKPRTSEEKPSEPGNRSSSECIQECWPGYQACQLICQIDPQTGACEWQCQLEYNGCIQECIEIPDRP